ncbi:MAG: AraC family transcriptional regulator [Bacteroidota bacterium]|nr:AraC family transcriptional regulator [Bacteroidota bacterium]
MDQVVIGAANRTLFDLKKLGFTSLVLLGRYSYKQPQASLDTHLHEGCLEICYLERGTQTYSIGDQLFHLKGGDVLINGSSIPHGTNGQPEEIGCLYWLQIDTNPKSGRILNLNSQESKTLINQLNQLSNIHFRGIPGMKKDLEEAFDLLENPQPGMSSIELGYHLLGFILKVIKAGARKHEKTISRQILQSINFIEKHFEEQILISDIARFARWSEPHFKQIFKSETGIPPGEYLQRIRIKKASELLSNSQLSIAEIAWRTGYTSSGYFATVFKKHKGQSPGEYRGN